MTEKKFLGPSGLRDTDAEFRRYKRELLRVTEERDIQKKATTYFAKDAK
jgi:transposase